MDTVEATSFQVGGEQFAALIAGTGTTVVFLHGFPDGPQTFEASLTFLAQHGFRAIALTLPGYQPQGRSPQGYALVHVVETVRRVVAEIASTTDASDRRVHLVGHDWGAAVGYGVAASAPTSLRSLVALSVPHPVAMVRALVRVPSQVLKSWYMLFFNLRGVAEWVLRAGDYRLIDTLWRQWSPGLRWEPGRTRQIKDALAVSGVTDAALAYYRALFDVWSASGRATLRLYRTPIEVPTLALTGMADGCIDSRIFEHAMPPAMFCGGLTTETLPGLGHFLHLEAPTVFNARLLRWLSEHESSERVVPID